MSVNQTPNPTVNDQQPEPFIPPVYMLALAGIAFLIAFIVLVTQPTFTVVGWGAFGLGVLSLIIWGFMAPDQVRTLLSGRTARYGGTTILVTLLFLTALVAIYAVVKSRNIRLDLTERNEFSLTQENRDIIAGLAVEPNTPNIRILAFYGSAQAAQRDQATILFDDYVRANSKISYEFIDPDRNPNLVTTYEVTRPGQIVVVPLDAAGSPINDRKQDVSFLTQEELSNAILRVSAAGDFRAYFVTTDSGTTLAGAGQTGLSDLNGILTDQLNWKTEEVTFLDLTAADSEIDLADPAINGQAIVIVGGNTPLNEQQSQFLINYLNNGGHVIIFAAPINNEMTPVLATTPALSEYLFANFGLRFSDNLVMDQTLAADQFGFLPGAITFDTSSSITQGLTQNTPMVFSLPRSIEVAPTLPENVSVVELVRSTDQSYAKLDSSVLQTTDIALTRATDTDPKGPFVLGASAENTQTGARVVLFGSQDVPTNASRGGNLSNLQVALLSAAWVTNFDEFFRQIPILTQPQRPQDQPIFVDAGATRNINFLTIFLLPFGVLGIGIFVWWSSREKART